MPKIILNDVEISTSDLQKNIDFVIDRLNLYKKDLSENKANCIFLVNDAIRKLNEVSKIKVIGE